MSELFKCDHCSYLTTRRYNLNRHYEMKHSTLYIDDNKSDNNTDENIVENTVDILQDTIVQEDTTTQDGIKCPTCYLFFKKQRYLTAHIPKCKNIQDSCECSICHNVFSTKNSKNRHMKVCKLKHMNELIQRTAAASMNTIPTNTTGGTTINIQNQQNIENQTNNTIIQNTINIISYKDDDTIQFLNDHISAEELTRIFNGRPTIEAFRKYTQLLLQRPENRLVKKTNSRSNCSQVFTDEQKWESRLDNEVYPKLASEIASNNWDRLRYVVDELKMNKRMLNHILDDLERLASGETVEDLNDYKKVISILKLLIIDMTHHET